MPRSPNPHGQRRFFAFLFAAAVGGFMAYLHFTGSKSPLAAGIVHGFFVASVFVFLFVGIGKNEVTGFGWWFVGGFAVVALGGAYLFSRQMRGKPWPGAVILLHGGAALIAIAALGAWLFG